MHVFDGKKWISIFFHFSIVRYSLVSSPTLMLHDRLPVGPVEGTMETWLGRNPSSDLNDGVVFIINCCCTQISAFWYLISELDSFPSASFGSMWRLQSWLGRLVCSLDCVPYLVPATMEQTHQHGHTDLGKKNVTGSQFSKQSFWECQKKKPKAVIFCSCFLCLLEGNLILGKHIAVKSVGPMTIPVDGHNTTLERSCQICDTIHMRPKSLAACTIHDTPNP